MSHGSTTNRPPACPRNLLVGARSTAAVTGYSPFGIFHFSLPMLIAVPPSNRKMKVSPVPLAKTFDPAQPALSETMSQPPTVPWDLVGLPAAAAGADKPRKSATAAARGSRDFIAGDTCRDDCNETLPGKIKSKHIKLAVYEDQSAL